MPSEPDLFTWAPPTPTPGARSSDPETSWRAALLNPKGRATDRRRTLETHCLHPNGLTDFELAFRLGGQQTSLGKRRGELRDLGLIKDGGERRAAPSGAAAIVWVITEDGKTVIEKLRKGTL